MGFIQPGKRLKRRKVLQNNEIQPINVETPILRPFSLQDLPVELLCKIFILAEPGNNLPVTNRYFNQILKFDPYSTEPSWKNISLAMKVIINHYATPFNDLINFQVIDTFCKRYHELLMTYECQFSNNNQYCKLLRLNLESIKINLDKFQNCTFGISTKVLNSKFISKRVIVRLSQDYPNIPIHDNHVLDLESYRRLLYLTLSFKLLYHLHDRLSNSPLDEEIMMLNNSQLIQINDNLSQELYSSNISLHEWVNDDKSPITFQNGIIEYCSYPHKTTKYIPYTIYKHGIDSIRKFELLTSLKRLNFDIEFTDKLLVNTLQHFTPDNLPKLNYHQLSLFKIIYFFSLTLLLQYTMIEFFRLYNTYSQICIDSFELNCEGKTIYEDVTSTIKPLLDHYFLNGKRNCDEMWKFVLKSENDSLTEILWLYSGPPPMNLMQEDD